MKRFFLKTASAVLSAVLIAAMASVAAIGVSAEDIPSIPTGKYTLKNSAVAVSSATALGTTIADKKAVRISPSLLQPSFDVSGKDYIYMWIYISDDSLLYDNNGDCIELCSGGKCDLNESALQFSNVKTDSAATVNGSYSQLKTGWNEYLFDIDDFKMETGGGLIESQLNYIGVVLRSNAAGLTFAVGSIYVLSEGDYTAKTDSGSNTTENKKNAIGVPVHDFNEAKATSASGKLSLSASIAPVSVCAYSYICMEIFVEDIDNLSKNFVLTISSSPEEGKQELSNSVAKTKLSSGWNTIFIDMQSFRISGFGYDDANFDGVCDVTKICRLAFSWSKTNANGKGSVKLGKITCSNSNVISSFPDSKYTLNANAIAVTTAEMSKSAKASGDKMTVRIIPEINGSVVDISSKEYLYFWIYVSDASLNECNSTEAMELTSSGVCDINENAIALSKNSKATPKTLFGSYGELKTGWNEYLVKISDYSAVSNVGGSASSGCDMKALNYIRIYFRTVANTAGKSVTYTLSTVYAVNESDLKGDAGLNEANASKPSESSTTSVIYGTRGSGDGGKTVIIVIIAVAFAIVIAVAAVIIIKSKTKKSVGAPASDRSEPDKESEASEHTDEK